MNKTVGDLLREARTKKGLALQTIAKQTGIPDHNFLAIELDQYSLIPEDKFEEYLRVYAETVGLDSNELKALLDNPVQEAPVEDIFQTSYDDLVETSSDLTYDFDENEHKTGRRSKSSHKREKKSTMPLAIMSLIALAILAFAGFFFLRGSHFQFSNPLAGLLQKKETNQPVGEAVAEESEKESTPEPEPEPVQETPAETTKLTVSGGGESLEVVVATAEKPVQIEISLDGESSWVGLTNSDMDPNLGVMLVDDYKNHIATINEDAKEAELSFGITQGISVKVNGQDLDMSAITSTSNSYISFTIE